MSFTDGATRKSLFIQVKWYDPDKLLADLEHIRQEHKDRAAEDYVFNVALDEIGGINGLHSNLDVIAPYFPGGSRATFDNVFVGSHYVKWSGSGMSYRAGMLNSAHRWRNLGAQKELWRQFAAAYHWTYFHFYINHEGVLDFMDERAVRQGYEAFLIQSVRDAHSIKPNRAVLWSPAVFVNRPLRWRERRGIRVLFKNVADGTEPHYGGIKWLSIQDMQGRSRDYSEANAVAWYRQVKQLHPWHSIGLNMEMFNQTPTEVQAREDYYQSRSVPVTASWELRWYMDTHAEL